MKAQKNEEWEGLSLKWEHGHNPELHVGNDVSDLNGLNDDDMEKLLLEKGFERV